VDKDEETRECERCAASSIEEWRGGSRKERREGREQEETCGDGNCFSVNGIGADIVNTCLHNGNFFSDVHDDEVVVVVVMKVSGLGEEVGLCSMAV
jgi:hypothetical protein